MAVSFFDRVYEVDNSRELRDLYDAWSESYEEDVEDHGYATPRRCARALAKFTCDFSAPVLDFGCGTGLSGTALARAGFRTIDGVDLSPDMLKRAKARHVYRKLRPIGAKENPVTRPGDYASLAAIGAIGAGAAPSSTFDLLMCGLRRGGKLVLSLNDHALRDRTNEARVSEWLDCGAARLLFREYGDHLPGLGLKSNVYVIERT